MNHLKSWRLGKGLRKKKKKRAGGLFLLHSQGGSFFLVSQNQTLFHEVIAIPLSHIPSWVQHLEKLKNAMHQIILLKLLFIAGHFVLSSLWQNVKAVLSVAFSFQHLQGSDMLPLHYTGENRQAVMIKAASQPTAGIGNFWCCIAVMPPVKDQISPFSAILVGFLNLLTCHVMDSFCSSFLFYYNVPKRDGMKLFWFC